MHVFGGCGSGPKSFRRVCSPMRQLVASGEAFQLDPASCLVGVAQGVAYQLGLCRLQGAPLDVDVFEQEGGLDVLGISNLRALREAHSALQVTTGELAPSPLAPSWCVPRVEFQSRCHLGVSHGQAESARQGANTRPQLRALGVVLLGGQVRVSCSPQVASCFGYGCFEVQSVSSR